MSDECDERLGLSGAGINHELGTRTDACDSSGLVTAAKTSCDIL